MWSPNCAHIKNALRRVGRLARLRGSPFGTSAGFTLIELANVIMIISVLTLIALPAIGDTRETVKRASCAERQRKIWEGAILYSMENFVPDGDVNVIDLAGGYLLASVGECPSSLTPDNSDYAITFAGGEPVAVTCLIMGHDHAWSPH